MREWRALNPDGKRLAQEKTKAWVIANKERALELCRRWRAENKERVSELNRRWRLANKERAAAHGMASDRRRKARLQGAGGNGVSTDQWDEIVKEFGGWCAYCLVPMSPAWMDHMDPLSKGGDHDVSNVVPVCGPCNMSKGAKTTLEFLTGFRLDGRAQRKVG